MVTGPNGENLVYRMLGEWVYCLANLGATPEELVEFFLLGENTTVMDVAKLEAACLARKDEECKSE